MTAKLDHQRDERDSAPHSSGPDAAAGDLGVSSERVGHSGSGRRRTDGLKDTSRMTPEGDLPPEQRPGAEEKNAEGIEPVAGYPTLDPRHARKPYRP